MRWRRWARWARWALTVIGGLALVGWGLWSAQTPAWRPAARFQLDGFLTLALGLVLGVWLVCSCVYDVFASRDRGRCQGCGYLLAGNVSGVCPECGAEVPR